ncbi:MAG: hypothetical protein A2534_01795 [Candidatus Magasanikbacteria bacterium RIFOXYD2_FULL_39_9]|uniref:Uncharacterized protein n=1 Tax=Candidatus Magasanikbacteria bacterium RIFOXYD1_FULL_40_23 TaxID=1798705 RepID=A0A1F6P7U2_9BACT|nr:MAG: hypothetical protein A2563_00055 [Candidatus Magasanikbacteria bacterium RIFOXYD1_FULL_40_23]OGH93466.1 MAG: hypothetical protein A2534_01795 [Candidatus Magasanikbacteria bacterium RIFOXYD2_FULL_39_9]
MEALYSILLYVAPAYAVASLPIAIYLYRNVIVNCSLITRLIFYIFFILSFSAAVLLSGNLYNVIADPNW